MKRPHASRIIRRLTRGLKGTRFFPKTEHEQDLFAATFDNCLSILRRHDAKLLRRAARLVDAGTL